MSATVVRRASPADAELWRAAARSILSAEDRDGRLATPADVAGALADERCYLFLASEGETPIGLLSAYRFPDAAAGGQLVYLYDIEVLAEHRRQGVGAGLVEALVAACREDGVRLVWAGTDVANVSARRTFERTGAALEGESYVEYEWELDTDEEAP